MSICAPGAQRGSALPAGEASVSMTMPCAAGSTRSTTSVRALAWAEGSPMRTGWRCASSSGWLRSGFCAGSHSTHRCSGPRNEVLGT
ncbi:hypothetical protein G6F57_021005 [Rhizopus arrhizus]|nr:hypothetical protein G6F57_021005 [Rhizopus arrhizus]